MKWYKRDVQAAREGMRLLSLEERGAYNTILDLIYETDNRLHDDDHLIAGFLRCDLRVWKRIKARLLELDRIYLQNGFLRDHRADVTFRCAAQSAEENASKGRKSGEARRKIKALAEQSVEPRSNDIDIPNGIDKDGGKPPKPPAPVIEPNSATVIELHPPEPRGIAALKAEAVDRRARAARWEEFRQAYPKREGSQSWPAAQKKYTALVASGELEADLIAGAQAYTRHLEATGNIGTRFVKQALTWLNQRGWNDEYLTGRRQQSHLMDAFDARRREAEARTSDRASGEGDGPSWDVDSAPVPF